MEGKMGGRRKKWKRMAELGMILTEADKIDTQLEPGKGSGPAPAMLHDDSNIPHLTKALLYYPYGYSTTKLGVSCIHESNHDLYIYLRCHCSPAAVQSAESYPAFARRRVGFVSTDTECHPRYM